MSAAMKILSSIGLLILLYLFLSNSGEFNMLIGSLGHTIESESMTLQGR